MKYLTAHIKSIAYSLTILMLFQSCVIYENVTYDLDNLSQYHNQKIKITTSDGSIYKLRWYEQTDTSIISIANTERHFINAENIQQIKTLDPYSVVISIDDALNYDGILAVSVKNNHGKIKEHTFIEFTLRDNSIQGLTKIGGDTTTLVIYKDQIKNFKVQDKTGSTAGSIAIGLGIALGLITGIALIQVSQEGWF